MKIRGRKPTREERKILSAANLDTYIWLVVKSTPTFLELMNKTTGEVLTLNR